MMGGAKQRLGMATIVKSNSMVGAMRGAESMTAKVRSGSPIKADLLDVITRGPSPRHGGQEEKEEEMGELLEILTCDGGKMTSSLLQSSSLFLH